MGTKVGQNWYQQSIMMSSVAGKCPLLCPKGHHHERSINILSGIIILFDAILTGWVSKDNSVGLI